MSDLAHAIHRPLVEDDAVLQHSNDLTPHRGLHGAELYYNFLSGGHQMTR